MNLVQVSHDWLLPCSEALLQLSVSSVPERCGVHMPPALQALVQDAVLKFKKDGKLSPKVQQILESDSQHLLSSRNASAGSASQQIRSSPVMEGRNEQQV